MTSPKTFNMTISVNELSFPLVTDTVDSDALFGRYGLLNSGHGAEYLLDRLVKQANGQVSEHKMHETCWGVNMDSEVHLLRFLIPTHTHISNTHSHSYGYFGTATCGVSSLQFAGNRVHGRIGPWHGYRQRRDYNF
jgi:hypothetical protein